VNALGLINQETELIVELSRLFLSFCSCFHFTLRKTQKETVMPLQNPWNTYANL